MEIYNDEPIHAKGNFNISVTYEVIVPEYVDNNQYQAIDTGITKIVTCINLKGKNHEEQNSKTG